MTTFVAPQILAHRGDWYQTQLPKNTLAALESSLQSGFGIETDIRSYNDTLYISHDPIKSIGNLPTFSSFLDLYIPYSSTSCIAINIKADGLTDLIYELLHSRNISNYFLFDQSVPDLVSTLRNQPNLSCFARLSEYECSPDAYALVDGIWFDYFKLSSLSFLFDKLSSFYSDSNIILPSRLALVSPELHGHSVDDSLSFWKDVASFHHLHPDLSIYLCTDFPLQAKEFFS